MDFYSNKFKETAIKRMLPPENASVKRLSKEIGVSDVALYTWRKEAYKRGYTMSGDTKNPEKWNAHEKMLVVVESYSMNEEELSEYCRRRGLYKEQIIAWRETCIKANQPSTGPAKYSPEEHKDDKKRIKELEKELNRKEKALAEAAALLVLRKKAQAIWGEDEED